MFALQLLNYRTKHATILVNILNYPLVGYEIRADIRSIFFLQIYLQNSIILILVCQLTSWFHYAKESIKSYDINLTCSLTKCNNGFISNSLPFGVVVGELNENTQRVLQFIQENPGCHLRWIKRDLNLSMGTVQYHLDPLERMGRIVSEKQSLHRFYFPVGSFVTLERNILKILNQDTAREILLLIIEKNHPTQTEIANGIKITPATANWHLKRLIDFGIISEEKEGKFKKYRINGSHNNVIKLLQNYHSSMWDKWSNRLAELFLSASSKEDKK